MSLMRHGTMEPDVKAAVAMTLEDEVRAVEHLSEQGSAWDSAGKYALPRRGSRQHQRQFWEHEWEPDWHLVSSCLS